MARGIRQFSILFASFLLAHLSNARAEAGAEHGTQDPQTAHDAAVTAAHGAGDAVQGVHEGGGGLPQFDPSSFASQVFWLAIAFAVLYVVFSRKTLPDIGSVLKKRETFVRSTLDSAKRQKEVAEGLQRDYERDIENARMDATGAFRDVEKAIKQKADADYKAFQSRAIEQIRKSETEIESAKARAMDDMQSFVAEIASKASERIIGVETDIDQAQTVVRALKTKAA